MNSMPDPNIEFLLLKGQMVVMGVMVVVVLMMESISRGLRYIQRKKTEWDLFDYFMSASSGGASHIPLAAIKECKSLLELFILMDMYPLPECPQQRATPSFSQQNPQQWQHGQKPVKTEPEDRTSSATSRFTIGPMAKKPKWYYEAFQKNDSQQSSTLTNEGHRIVAAQTATVMPHPSTDAGHMPDLPKYKMDRLPRGMCIIFNVENFATKSNLKQRLGTQKDVEALLNTFQNQLKFETRVVQDPTKKKYIECLQNIGRLDHSKFDCFVCVILSHGCEGHVSGTDGGTVSIDALTGLFRGDYVPSLVNKPKLFFIQACQGKYPQESVDIQQDDTASLPCISDTLVSYATIPGYASFRNVNQGSLFIISLCNIINTYYKKKVDLLSMLTMVNDLMSRQTIEGKWMEMGKQIGIHSNILRKQIFFNEGLNE